MPPFVESFLWIEFANNFFLFTIWLLMSQILAIFVGTASSTNFNHSFLSVFDQIVTRSVAKRSDSSAWMGLNRKPFDSIAIPWLTRPLSKGHLLYIVNNFVVRLMVKFCWSTKIIFQFSCVFFSKTKKRTGTGIWKLRRWNSYSYSHWNS